MKPIIPLALSAVLIGCAATPAGKVADAGVHADHATTAVGIGAMGAAELNPLAPVTAPLRYLAVREAEGRRCDDRRGVLKAVSASGWGAAGWNVLMLAAGPAPAVVAGLIGAAGGYQSADCEATPATAAQIALLARWRRAYADGDPDALRAVTDNTALVAAYSDLFERTEAREVRYSRLEAVREGFVAAYEATLTYRDGTRAELSGDLRFEVEDGKITEVEKT